MELVRISIQLFEVAGIVAMVAGIPLAAWLAVRTTSWSQTRTEAGIGGFYRAFRRALGRAIVLGLEFLVAAQIIRTVSDSPTLSTVTALGIIVLIRTFLGVTLEAELQGRWPWQQREPSPVRPTAGPTEPRPLARSTPAAPRATVVYGSAMEPQHS